MQNQRDSRQSGKSLPKISLKDFMKPWARLCAAYPRFEISEPTMTVYYEHLCKYDCQQLIAAIDICVAHSPYFPAVAEIIAAIKPRTKPNVKLLGEPYDPRVKDLVHALTEKIDIRKKP